MRIAVTKATLRVPPTYFAVQHALRLRDRHDIEVVTLAAEIADAAVARAIPIRQAVGVPLPFRARELVMPAAFPAFRGLVRRFAPDVVHQHAATWSIPALDAARASDAPAIVTLHGGDVFVAGERVADVPLRARPMLRWHHRNVARAFADAGRLLSASRYLADVALANGAPADRLQVHYQGVDTDWFTPGDAGSSATGEPVVLFVGALTAAKGVPDLVEASLAVSPRHPHRLRLVGGGPLGAGLQAAGHPHVELTGSLDRAAVRHELRRAHVLVLPTQATRGRSEAAGLVLLEAQAAGVPVIAYRSGGTPEMLRDGQTGVLVPERDRAALGAALADVLALPAAAHTRMGAAARAFVVAERSLAVSTDELEAHYRDLTGGVGA